MSRKPPSLTALWPPGKERLPLVSRPARGVEPRRAPGSAIRRFTLGLLLFSSATFAAIGPFENSPAFVAFDSGPVRPLALSKDGTRLFVTNISDNRLEIFDVSSGIPQPLGSVVVGLEPVAVAVLDDRTVFVANHLSDSVSVVDVSGTPQVKKTLLVGDEPRDLIITDPDGEGPVAPRLFVTTAHRGQHRTHPSIRNVPGAGDPQLTTPGVGRADVWVFATSNLGRALGGVPLKIVTLFTDTPRALATSRDGRTVFVAGFFSQNRTAVVPDGVVCPGFENAEPCTNLDGFSAPDGRPGGFLPGGKPGPGVNVEGIAAPDTGLIVRFDPDAGPVDDDPSTGIFVDELGRDWNNGIRFRLPDKDVFAIDALSLEEVAHHVTVGTTIFNMVTNPVSGTLYVSNTEARNEVRFEGPGGGGSTVQGHLAESRITVIRQPEVHAADAGNVLVRHLNKHLDYSVLKAPATVREKSLATPLDLVVSPDGETLYVAAFGSQAVGVFSTTALENDTFVPDPSSQIRLTGGGPGGLALTRDGSTLFVYTRFDNGISVVDTRSAAETEHVTMFNPEPPHIVEGRPFLYDARISSSNGEASCSSCHIFGDNDRLAWDLGNPDEDVTNDPIPINLQQALELSENLDGQLVNVQALAAAGIDLSALFGDGGVLQSLAAGQEDAPPSGGGDGGPFGGPDLIDSEAVNGGAGLNEFHPMKGPMTTQTLRGLRNHGAMHWRGDRATGFFNADPASPTLEDAFDEELSFKNFIVAFDGLLGRNEPITSEEMQKFTDFQLDVFLPPNPIRNLDNSLTKSQERGKDFYFGLETEQQFGPFKVISTRRSDGGPAVLDLFLAIFLGANVTTGFTCEGCHRLDPSQGFFGTGGHQSFENETQIVKIPHLRNVYTKVGAFGMSASDINNDGPGVDLETGRFRFMGDQIKGFGVLHDGAVDHVNNFFHAVVFSGGNILGQEVGFENEEQIRDVEAFVHAFPADLAPIVGQQVTVEDRSSVGLQRIRLLLERARTDFVSKNLGGEVKEAEVVVKGVVDGEERGFLYKGRILGVDSFETDRGELISAQGLRALLDGPATFTAVPPGSGHRIALDRDLDGVLDGLE